MSVLSCIGASIDTGLLNKFGLLPRRARANPNEACRDLIRGELVEGIWGSSDSQIVGGVTLVYDRRNVEDVSISTKGVRFGRLTITTSGAELK